MRGIGDSEINTYFLENRKPEYGYDAVEGVADLPGPDGDVGMYALMMSGLLVAAIMSNCPI